LVSINFSYVTSYRLSIRSGTHRLVTIHNVTDDRCNTVGATVS